ncbi:MAG: gamma-glutamyl-gamma-aminobutyrate hydrolase family protein [Erysipelotrichaceae bacterium]|nr:gamma-glutamyl-gamma-aminobutyrate hydrolase family protein [Erysipelotrichaceae bacterium]
MIKIAIAMRYAVDHSHGYVNKRYYIPKDFKDIADELNYQLFPIISPQSAETLAEICDFLLLPGSIIDIDPAYFHEEKADSILLNEEFDLYASDKACIEAFRKRNKKILAICGGHQVINVYFGGTLRQGIEGHANNDLHEIVIEEGSQLAKIYGCTRVMVNSHHHHAAGRVGENLRVTARSLDGTIEALEGENILAVQYHPEMLHDTEFFRKYFEA